MTPHSRAFSTNLLLFKEVVMLSQLSEALRGLRKYFIIGKKIDPKVPYVETVISVIGFN
jgi:hypothetical protein